MADEGISRRICQHERCSEVGMKPCEKCGKTIEFELQDLCDKCLHEENRQFRERQRRAAIEDGYELDPEEYSDELDDEQRYYDETYGDWE